MTLRLLTDPLVPNDIIATWLRRKAQCRKPIEISALLAERIANELHPVPSDPTAQRDAQLTGDSFRPGAVGRSPDATPGNAIGDARTMTPSQPLGRG